MEKKIQVLVGGIVERYETHDLDGHPDFSIWLPKAKKPLLAECKNVRDHEEAYREGGKIVAYKAETQKTRASKGDPTSRFYGVGQFDILGVCLGKKTGNWSDFMFARVVDLARHETHKGKLAVFQRVPLPDSESLAPWYNDLGELLKHSPMHFDPLYQTKLGKAYCADSLDFMRAMPGGQVDLVLTSPPYALHFKKEYGNADQKEYVKWFLPFAEQIKRVLTPHGSFVLNVGGSWTPGAPIRSLYHFRLLLALCDELGFELCQEFFWYNPAKMPAPAEWVNVRRIRVKDSVEYIFWLSPSKFPKADNSRVLQAYSKDMERLIRRGIKQTKRPSGHNITPKFSQDRGGSIPGQHHSVRKQRKQQPLHQAIQEAGQEDSSGPVSRLSCPDSLSSS